MPEPTDIFSVGQLSTESIVSIASMVSQLLSTVSMLSTQ